MTRFAVLSTALTGATLALALNPAASHVHAQGSKAAKTPLTLLEQGSFHVGGTIEFRENNSSTVPGTGGNVPGEIAVNHMYVEYQIPAAQKYRYPVIMMHGGGHTAKTYETTPDGREGWFTTFARRGFSPYAVDAPNRGRSGYDPTHRFKVLAGLEPASALEIGNIYSKQGAWVSFRFGPKYGERYPGQLFPFDYMDDYVKELVPSYRGAEQNPLIVNDLVALIDKLGPCILLGHSTGGANVLNAATQRPDKVKGLIALEPSGFPPEANRAALKTVPTIIVLGDNRAPSSNDAPKALTSYLSGLGGDATTYLLPEHGISGNGHMMMMESNSEQIADLLEDWIKQHVPSASMTTGTSSARPTK